MAMTKLDEMKKRHQQEVNDFNIMFAFSNEQFKNGMKENFNLTENDIDKILSIGGGGYILKTDKQAFHDMFERQKKPKKQKKNC